MSGLTREGMTDAEARIAYPMSSAAYDLYWASKTPHDEDVARLLIAITRHIEGRGDVNPKTGELLNPCPHCSGSRGVCDCKP